MRACKAKKDLNLFFLQRFANRNFEIENRKFLLENEMSDRQYNMKIVVSIIEDTNDNPLFVYVRTFLYGSEEGSGYMILEEHQMIADSRFIDVMEIANMMHSEWSGKARESSKFTIDPRIAFD